MVFFQSAKRKYKRWKSGITKKREEELLWENARNSLDDSISSRNMTYAKPILLKAKSNDTASSHETIKTEATQ